MTRFHRNTVLEYCRIVQLVLFLMFNFYGCDNITQYGAPNLNTNCGYAHTVCPQYASCLPNNDDFECRCNTGYSGDNQTFCYLDLYKCCLNQSTCKYNEFRCLNGKCISLSLYRNSYPDCDSGEDEECFVTDNFTAAQIKCDNKCYTVESIVDDSHSCKNKKHRLLCTFYGFALGDKSFLCKSSSVCVPIWWVNDHICSCPDCSDEMTDMAAAQSQQSSPSEIKDDHLSIFELNHHHAGLCGSSYRPCHKNARCIFSSETNNYECRCLDGYLGDGVYFCYLDARACCLNSTQCPLRSFRCLNGTCLPIEKYRDGINDCSNAEDEECFVSEERAESQIKCDGTCYLIEKIMTHNTSCQRRRLTGKLDWLAVRKILQVHNKAVGYERKYLVLK